MPVLATPVIAFSSHLRTERDPSVRTLLMAGIASGDADGIVSTSDLVLRARSAGADAPLASFLLASRATEGSAEDALDALRSPDRLVRAHAARGLGLSALPSATGELAGAYAFETDALVRRCIASALVARQKDRGAPLREYTLDIAQRFDPDALVRIAARAQTPPGAVAQAPRRARSVAWLATTTDAGGDAGAPVLAAFVDESASTLPISFDDEGFALVLTASAGSARVVLAPRLPPYDPSPP